MPAMAALMALILEFFASEIDELDAKNVRIQILGDKARLPEKQREALYQAENRTGGNTGLRLNIAINYGGRDEILRAARAFAADCVAGKHRSEELDEKLFEAGLSSAGLPDPDLIIRPGGEKRVSNFLLWQGAYSEFLFTDTLWPDFKKEDLDAALLEYQRRHRRYGGI